jgi:hypothetical protein
LTIPKRGTRANLAFAFTQRILDVIAAHDPTRPLFLFWAMHVVHGPLEVPTQYIDEFPNITYKPRQVYTAMVKFADDKVGAVVAALKAKGMWDNLLWVTSADNGGPISGGASNYPLRGGKVGNACTYRFYTHKPLHERAHASLQFTNFEGGIRVTAFASGGAIPSAVRGTTYDGLMALPGANLVRVSCRFLRRVLVHSSTQICTPLSPALLGRQLRTLELQQQDCPQLMASTCGPLVVCVRE